MSSHWQPAAEVDQDGLLPVIKFLQGALAMKAKVSRESSCQINGWFCFEIISRQRGVFYFYLAVESVYCRQVQQTALVWVGCVRNKPTAIALLYCTRLLERVFQADYSRVSPFLFYI